MSNDIPSGWEGILDPGEKILWQGGPDPSIVLSPGSVATFLFGLAFAGFALFWMIMASLGGGFFWMFGLLHFGVGVSIASGGIVWPAWRRRHSWYTLTDKRAFIATDMPITGRKLKSYPITTETVLEFDARDPASIYFHSDYKRTKNGSREVRIGFERIAEGKHVYDLMRSVQRGTREP